ncbi:hypothetical protein [Aquamicrobium defluvii]|uniref:Uncharacterized protein n=1 Tax=Aquamicrobium defluvii TaxID=69279 RepID=A0A4R6YEX4_9HYPH|nr:hypothetical protein [Aquamicrobium defluvii]TDR34666.1 hypothetical protein DES43_11397 [Aquamicrobium defluvii]
MCADCEARRKMAREALLNARFSEALGHVAKGAAEILGIKEKTGVEELAEHAAPSVKSRKR